MSDSVLADVAQNEGDEFITEDSILNVGNDEQENETPASSPEEQKQEEEDPPHQGDKKEDEATEESSNTDDENNIPFHKHPRWKEREREWNDKLKTIEQQNEELRSMVDKVSSKDESKVVEIPSWFGGDEAAWNQFQEYQRSERERVRLELVEEQQQAQRDREEQVKRWENYQTQQLNRLEDEGKEFDRNELVDVMLKYRPTDDRGNFDFDKGYEIYSVVKQTKAQPSKEKSKERKQLVDISQGKTSGDIKKDFTTPEDIRGKSIYDLVRE